MLLLQLLLCVVECACIVYDTCMIIKWGDRKSYIAVMVTVRRCTMSMVSLFKGFLIPELLTVSFEGWVHTSNADSIEW